MPKECSIAKRALSTQWHCPQELLVPNTWKETAKKEQASELSGNKSKLKRSKLNSVLCYPTCSCIVCLSDVCLIIVMRRYKIFLGYKKKKKKQNSSVFLKFISSEPFSALCICSIWGKKSSISLLEPYIFFFFHISVPILPLIGEFTCFYWLQQYYSIWGGKRWKIFVYEMPVALKEVPFYQPPKEPISVYIHLWAYTLKHGFTIIFGAIILCQTQRWYKQV